MTTYYHSGVALAKKKGKDIHIVETPVGIGDMLPVIAEGSSVPRTLRQRFGDVVNVKDFGAAGDGNTDDTKAIQAALNHGAGKRVVFPAATYKVSASLSVREKSVVDGCNALLLPNGDFDVFTVTGAGLSEEVPIASEVGVGDTVISTTTPHGLSRGDYALLWSQRDALSDAAGEYRLGYHQGLKCYFAEPVLIKSVASDTAVEVAAGLLFPGYRPDATQDSGSGRACATLSKLTFIEGVSIVNFRVRHGYSGKVVTASFAKDLLISHISGEFDDKQVIGVSLFACLNSTVERAEFTAPENIDVTTSTSGFWKWTGVTAGSCWGICVKDSTFNNEPNGIDFTFSENYWCSILCTAANNTFNHATANAVTSHPGVWSNRFFQNSFVDCAIPATLRSRRVIFTGNEITKGAPAVSDKSEVAVILQGSAIDSVVTHNEICGYSVGIEDHTFSNGVAMLPWHGNIISLNKINNCNYGILASSGNSGNTDLMGALIQGNSIDFSTYGIEFDSWRHGVTAIGNILRGESESKSYAFKIYGDSTRHTLHDNTIARANLYQITFTTSVEYPVTLDAYNGICVGYDVNLGTGTYLNGSGYNKAGRRYERVVAGNGESSKFDRFPSGVAYLADKAGGAIYAAASANDTGSPALNFYGSDASLKATLSYAFSSNRLNLGLNGALWFFNTGAFAPTKDAAYSLGMASARVSAIFAATAAINTSDARCKENVAAPDDALMRAWGKVNFKVFQFKDAVEKKGGDARIHVGVIAQEVKAAFESEGLDASRYGLFCHDAWEDEYEDVTVVDQPEVTDDDGNITTPEVSHVEKRLVTAAGDRYGIRYEEALALECAYQRWRLAQIEARLS